MDAQKNATYFVRNDGKSWALEGKKVHTEMNIQRDGGVLRERMGVPGYVSGRESRESLVT